jgi:fucose permease
VPNRLLPRSAAAAVLGCAAFLLIGWSSLLVPSLIRSIEADFGQNDAGIGLFYLVNAIAYAAGSYGGGLLTERFGWRTVLVTAALLHAGGLVVQASVPSWTVFLVAGIPRGFGSGAIDGGVNGLYLELYPTARGRALNYLHLFFALGALGSPLAVGFLVEAGASWQVLMLATGVLSLPLAGLLALAWLPSGLHSPAAKAGPRLGLMLPLLVLAIAIGCYVAAEIGVSNWLVRFLDRAPLSTATGALSLFWGGLTVGRLVSARVADRFDHTRFATASTLVASVALVAAVVVPALPVSIVLFGIVGFAFGPIYPVIMAIAGERFPDRSAAVSGFLAGTAVVGSVLYPPVMGFMSVTVGLPVAMLGLAVLGFACAAALLISARPSPRQAGPSA